MKADMAFAVGLMLILSIVTLIYMPLVLSIFLPGVSVNPTSIAVSLLVLIFLPLIIGTFVKSRYSNLYAQHNHHDDPSQEKWAKIQISRKYNLIISLY